MYMFLYIQIINDYISRDKQSEISLLSTQGSTPNSCLSNG